MIFQLPHALEYCVVAFCFDADQEINEEKPGHEDGIEDFGYG